MLDRRTRKIKFRMQQLVAAGNRSKRQGARFGHACSGAEGQRSEMLGKTGQDGNHALGRPDHPQDRANRRISAEPVVQFGFNACDGDQSGLPNSGPGKKRLVPNSRAREAPVSLAIRPAPGRATRVRAVVVPDHAVYRGHRRPTGRPKASLTCAIACRSRFGTTFASRGSAPDEFPSSSLLNNGLASTSGQESRRSTDAVPPGG
jgi:hypothetical protein